MKSDAEFLLECGIVAEDIPEPAKRSSRRLCDPRLFIRDILQVLVRVDGVFFQCCHERPDKWRCGRCGRGSLGRTPRVGDACAICHAAVAEVLMMGADGPVVNRDS